MKKNTQQVQGFTIIEFMMSIALLGIILGFVYVQKTYSKNNALFDKRNTDLKEYRQGLQSYYARFEKYPTTSGTWYSTGICVAQSSNVTSNFIPDIAGYIANISRDPGGTTDCIEGPMYMYKSNGYDYKIIVYNAKNDVNTLVKKNPDMIDPARPATSSTPSFGIWTIGAIKW